MKLLMHDIDLKTKMHKAHISLYCSSSSKEDF